MTSKGHSLKECSGGHDTLESEDSVEAPGGIVSLQLLCEKRWEAIKLSAEKLPTSTIKTVDPDKSLLQILQEKEKCLGAEIKVLKATKPDSLPADHEIQFEVLKQDLLSSIEQLKETLSLAGSQETELRNSIERENEYKQQLLTVNRHLENRVESFQDRSMTNTQNPLSTILNELNSKIHKVENVDKQLSKDFNQFLSEHFPLPKTKDMKVYKKNMRLRSHDNETHNLLPLKTILEELMNKCIDEPSDPYITLTDWYWPPYIELLSRCQIVLQHPDHDNKIKLVPFHL